MKKILSIIFAIIICMPGYATAEDCTKSTCATLASAEYTLHPEKLPGYAEKLNEWKEATVGSEKYSCEKSNGGFAMKKIEIDCQPGQKRKDCIPEECWDVLSQNSINLNKLIQQEIQKKCCATTSSSQSQTPNTNTLSKDLSLVEVVACPLSDGIKTTVCEKCANPDKCTTTQCSGTCVVQECHEPCYKKKGNKCELQSVEGGTFALEKKQCKLTCTSSDGYAQDPKNQWKCTRDCTSTITDPNVKNARYKGDINPAKVKCEIVDCKGKYHRSDDKQSCIPDQAECTAEQLRAVHATTGYLITKTNTCVPKTCIQPQYRPDGNGDARVCVDMVGKTCNVKHATSAKYEMSGNELVCKVVSCDTNNGYHPSDDKRSCIKNCLTEAQKKEPLATEAEYNSTGKCIITKCAAKDGKNYLPNADGDACEVTDRPCDKTTDSKIWPEHATAASYTKSKNSEAKCVATECEPGYKPVKGQCINQVGQQCKISHATDAKYELRDGKLVCVVVSCDTAKGYTKTQDNLECIKDCLSTMKNQEPLATKAEYDSTGKCIIKKCDKKDGKSYIASEDGQKCEETERDCNKTTDSKIWPEHATAASYKKSKTGGTAKCVATECEDGYDVDGGKCVSVNDSDCDKKPENSKKSHRYYDINSQQTLCIVDECKKGYKISNDLLSCILESALSEENAKKRMEELKDNAQKMKEREQSTENKLLGAAGIATVGIGGKNIASALSEQNADRKAENDMKAYLATFRCDYGQGRNIVGGETNIQLPGANELMQYTTEYKQLALNLKSDKAALGMMPGIESETVFDSATTGLYDDVGIGTQKGAFTSLSRALQDAESADAAEWQAMKDATAKKLKTGIVVAGAGALGTMAANLAINHGKGDQSGNIWNDYEGKKEPVIDVSPVRKPCPAGTTGTYIPNCECTGNSYFSTNDNCVPCGEHQIVNATKDGCECDTANGYQAVQGTDPLECKKPVQETKCELTGYFRNPPCECVDGATQSGNNCICDKPGYKEQDNTCKKCDLTGLTQNNNCDCVKYAEAISGVCKCKTQEGYEPDGQGGCKKKITLTAPQEVITVNTSTNSDSTFGPGECKIETSECNQIIENIQKSLNSKFSDQKITYDAWKKDASAKVTIEISGYTDRQGFKPDQRGRCLNRTVNNKQKRSLNKELSEGRAWAMHDCIETHKNNLFGGASVTYDPSNKSDMGKGQDACTKCDKGNKEATFCEDCRRVDVNIKISK